MIDKDTDEFKKGEIAFDLVKRRYDAEISRIKDLDGKAGSQIGYISVVLSLLIGLGTFQLFDKLSEPKFYIPYFVGIALLLLSFLCSLAVIKVRSWTWVPKADAVIKEGFNTSFHAWNLMLRVATAMSETIIEMKAKNDKKADQINRSWYLLIGGLGAIVLYVIVVTLTSGGDNGSIVKSMVVENMTVARFIPG